MRERESAFDSIKMISISSIDLKMSGLIFSHDLKQEYYYQILKSRYLKSLKLKLIVLKFKVKNMKIKV